MSPNYYMTFAALLGVDLYDGLNSEELSEIIQRLEPGRIGTLIVEAALTRVGDPYSRGRRGNHVDCSSFAHWAYAQAGIEIPTSSVEQAKFCHNNGYEVDLDDLQPGDLLYWSKPGCNCGRWREIHHAGIYLGNNMVIDASSSKGCVVIRQLWSNEEWHLVMGARPYEEETPVASAPAAGSGG
jgi:cell wall-associated NlpC family hydrolase